MSSRFPAQIFYGKEVLQFFLNQNCSKFTVLKVITSTPISQPLSCSQDLKWPPLIYVHADIKQTYLNL